MTNMSPDRGLLSLPPHQHTASSVFPHLFLFSAYWSHTGVAWPSRRTIWYAVVLNRTEGSAWKGALYWIGRSPYTTTSCFRPAPHRQPCVPRMKKCKQRGSVHPGIEHRTSFILSPMLLPDSPELTSGWLYFEIKKYPPWWWTEVIWKHIPSWNRCQKDKLGQCSLQLGESNTCSF